MNLPNGWKYVKLSDISTELTETAGNQEYETLSISAGIGFVNQAKKFGKELSGKQYEKYIVLHEGDFSYNKGNSKKYPQGCIYQLKNRKIAAVPNVFESFRLKIGNNDFYEQLFISGFLNKQLTSKINHGIRDDGLLNLTGKDFYNCIIPFPPLAEQQKIAQILTKQDELISLKEKLLEQKQQQKKWLMQKLLEVPHENSVCTEKLSINNVVIDKSRWKKEYLGNMCTSITSGGHIINSDNGKYPIYGSTGKIGMSESFAYDEELILIARVGANAGSVYVINGKSSVSDNTLIVIPNLSIDFTFAYWLLCFENLSKLTFGTGQPLVTSTQVKNITFFLPTLPEQKIIAQVLSAADKEIDLLKQEIELQKQKKKALAQQLLSGKVRVKI